MEEIVQEADGTSDVERGEEVELLGVEDEVHEDDEIIEVEEELPPVKVRVLHRQDQAALVQWVDEDGNLGRTIIPTSELHGNRASPLTLQAGIPGGEPWSEIPGVDEHLEQLLYKRGIWEPEDMLRLSHLARRAIQQALVVPLMKTLLEHSKRKVREG